MRRISYFILAIIFIMGCFTGCSKSVKPFVKEDDKKGDRVETEPKENKLGDTIVFEEGWTIDEVISAEEISVVMNESPYVFFPEASSDAPNGNPAGGYLIDGKDKSKIGILAFVAGNEEKYEFFKGFAIEGSVSELAETMYWDKAFFATFSDGSAAVVLLRGKLCVRINWFPETYPAFESPEPGTLLAERFINNLFGGNREDVSENDTTETAAVAPADMPDAAPTDSEIPDEVPEYLTDAASINIFATNLFVEHVGANMFLSPVFTEAEKEDARKALKVIIEACDKAIAMNEGIPELFYLRGGSYAEVYYDTKDVAYKEKGLADLQTAIDMGIDMAKNDYDQLQSR